MGEVVNSSEALNTAATVYAALLQEDLEVNHKPLFFISMMV